MSIINYPAPENPSQFSVLPKGKYEALLSAYELKKSEKGNDMAKLTLKVFHNSGENNVWDYLVFTDGSAWKVKAFVEAVGQIYGEPLDLDKAMGKLFLVALKVESYDGKENNKVELYLPYTGQPKPIEEQIPDSDLPF